MTPRPPGVAGLRSGSWSRPPPRSRVTSGDDVTRTGIRMRRPGRSVRLPRSGVRTPGRRFSAGPVSPAAGRGCRWPSRGRRRRPASRPAPRGRGSGTPPPSRRTSRSGRAWPSATDAVQGGLPADHVVGVELAYRTVVQDQHAQRRARALPGHLGQLAHADAADGAVARLRVIEMPVLAVDAHRPG